MCECGCVSMGEFWQMPGPDGSIYVIQKYPGCHDCSSPSGVILRKLDKNDIDYFDYKYFKELKFRDDFDKSAEIPFVDEAHLARELSGYLAEAMKHNMDKPPFDEIWAETLAEEFAKIFMKRL